MSIPNTIPGFWETLEKQYPPKTIEEDFKRLIGSGPYPENLIKWIERVGWPKVAEKALTELPVNIAIELMAARSPIEVMLYFALRAEFAADFGWGKCRIAVNPSLSRILDSRASYPASQAPWERRKLTKDEIDYEIDIYFELGPDDLFTSNMQYFFRFAIECDGHDYHERTKEQARKDKIKDRTLERLGFIVIHFTGSEIYKDPFACAKEVRNIHTAESNRLRSLLDAVDTSSDSDEF